MGCEIVYKWKCDSCSVIEETGNADTVPMYWRTVIIIASDETFNSAGPLIAHTLTKKPEHVRLTCGNCMENILDALNITFNRRP